MPVLSKLSHYTLFLSCLILADIPVAQAQDIDDFPLHIRLGGGLSEFEDTAFFDMDCNSGNEEDEDGPPAFFGCGEGPDGKSTGAYGDFDTTYLVEAAVGHRFGDWLFGEVAVSYRPEWTFSGQSNFTGIPLDTAPVEAEGWNLSLMANAQIMLSDLLELEQLPIQVFLSGGLVVAFNHTDEVMYQFTHAGIDDRRYLRSGNNLDWAWSLGAGIGYELTERVAVQLAYRYVDLGHVETDAGDLVWSREDK